MRRLISADCEFSERVSKVYIHTAQQKKVTYKSYRERSQSSKRRRLYIYIYEREKFHGERHYSRTKERNDRRRENI